MLPVSAGGSAHDRRLSFRLFQFQSQSPDQALEFRNPLVCGSRGRFILEDRTGMFHELLLPLREQAFVYLQFAADPLRVSGVLQDFHNGARFTLWSEIEWSAERRRLFYQ